MIKFYYALFVSLTFFFVTSFAQGTETFTNIPAASSSYSARTWTGDNGLTWNATDARTDSLLNGAAICIRVGSITCNNIPNGIGNLTFKHKQIFSGTGGLLTIKINGVSVGTVNPTTTVATATISNINVTGSFNLEIAQSTSGLRILIDDVSWTSSASGQPCTEPTAQASSLILTPATSTISGSFTAASPSVDGYLVVQSTSPSLSSPPADATTYSAGQALGGGTVVSSGSAVSFTASGLSAGTTYYFFVYSYNNNNCTGGPNYFTTAPLSGNTITNSIPACVAPTTAPTGLSLSAAPASISGTFTASATANRYLTVISSSNSLSATPVNGTTYSAGQSLGGGTVVSYGTTTSFTATGLTSGSTYYLFIFSANGDCSGEPFYYTTALTGSKATSSSGNLPATYYNAANGLTCSALKTALSTIISSNTTVLSYTPGLWDAYYRTDVKINDANTATVIWDMYSDNPTGADPYTYTPGTGQCGTYNSEGDCYNREHSFPSSWFNDGSPMYTDINHLFPTDGWVNNKRSNYPYGETSSPTFTSMNGSKLGPSSFAGYTGTVFEPINEYKGDFARAQFYMATRYESQIAGWQSNGTADEALNGTSYQAFDDWYIKLLYKWHLQDPVSQKEINRNDSVFVIQGNRNPYIDHPEWVAAVWSCTNLLSTTGVNDVLNVPQKAVILYPNPVTNQTATIRFEKAFTQNVTVQIIDITGKILRQQTVTAGQLTIQLNTSKLETGIYTAKINTSRGIITRTFVVK